MSGMLIYVAGPMTGRPNFNRGEFFLAGARLAAAGYRVLNPANWPDGMSRREYMRLDLPMVLSCDGLAVLPGWEDAEGARAEVAVARYAGIPVHTVEVWLGLARTDRTERRWPVGNGETRTDMDRHGRDTDKGTDTGTDGTRTMDRSGL